MSRGGARPGAGRKLGSRNKATLEVQELARQYAPAALAELARLSTAATSEQARVAASNAILDRAYGKPALPMQHDLDLTRLSDEQLSVLALVLGADPDALGSAGRDRASPTTH